LDKVVKYCQSTEQGKINCKLILREKENKVKQKRKCSTRKIKQTSRKHTVIEGSEITGYR